MEMFIVVLHFCVFVNAYELNLSRRITELKKNLIRKKKKKIVT